MKTLIIASILGLSTLSVNAAEITKSEMKLRKCLASVYTSAGATVSKSDLSLGVKSCRESVRNEQKNEREQKKRMKITEQIAKLQAKLKG